MIKASDAIRVVRSLIGTPYAELDCINLIKKVIRDAQGGVKTYTTAGTNTLWRSYDASAKYRDLTWRQTGLSGAQAGMIAFKADGEDFHHAGIVTDVGTVIHSSSTQGGRGVVETPLSSREGWTHLAVHRYIETAAGAAEESEAEDMAALYKARVITEKDPLNVRQVPETGKVIDKIPSGAVVEVYSTGEWPRVRYGETMGYVSAKYLERIAEGAKDEPGEDGIHVVLVFTDSAGNTWIPVGDFKAELRVAED